MGVNMDRPMAVVVVAVAVAVKLNGFKALSLAPAISGKSLFCGKLIAAKAKG